MVNSELDEVLCWDCINKITDATINLKKQFYPNNPDEFYIGKQNFYIETIHTKVEFLNRILYYNKNGKPLWISGKNNSCDDISHEQLQKACQNATFENGKLRAEQTKSAIIKWASHIEFYTNKVLGKFDNTILELTVGAGVGTSSIVRKMSNNDLFVGMDIDFRCAKTVDGIGKYYNANALGLCCNLWNMPFNDETFTVVCSHLGIDECRELPRIISEAVRVLKPKGKIVLTCRNNGYIRHKAIFDLFNFSESESVQCLKDARLYSSLTDLDELMSHHKLIKTDFKQFGGDRYVVEYMK